MTNFHLFCLLFYVFLNETSIDYRREFFRHILFEKSFLRQIHLFFFMVIIVLFRVHPVQELSFSGIILFRNYSIQNESFSGTIPLRNFPSHCGAEEA